MKNDVGKYGEQRISQVALDMMSGWDDEEDVTIADTDLTLTSGVTGDYGTGVGSGSTRSKLYARGLHNYGSSAATVKYQTIDGGTSKTFTCYLTAGASLAPMGGSKGISKIVLSGTTASATIKVWYKDRFAMSQAQER